MRRYGYDHPRGEDERDAELKVTVSFGEVSAEDGSDAGGVDAGF